VRERFDAALKFVTTVALGAIIGAALMWWKQFGPVHVSGVATVIDGDSIKIGDTNIRLAGIDAPEMPVRDGVKCNKLLSRPECIERSSIALNWRAGGEHVRCWITGSDALKAEGMWGRPLGVCFHGDTELNAWMLGECLADLPDNPAYQVPRYYPVAAERTCLETDAPVASTDLR
jgi:endonuclease YncB( thermonuclease family)